MNNKHFECHGNSKYKSKELQESEKLSRGLMSNLFSHYIEQFVHVIFTGLASQSKCFVQYNLNVTEGPERVFSFSVFSVFFFSFFFKAANQLIMYSWKRRRQLLNKRCTCTQSLILLIIFIFCTASSSCSFHPEWLHHYHHSLSPCHSSRKWLCLEGGGGTKWTKYKWWSQNISQALALPLYLLYKYIWETETELVWC